MTTRQTSEHEGTPVVSDPAVTSAGATAPGGLDTEALGHLFQRKERGRGRGWVMRRALAVADILALSVAFMISFAVAGPSATDHVGDWAELGLFYLSLPFWLVVANLYGLYDSDEERADHSTADDIFGVFHLVTIGSWLLLLAAQLTGAANPSVVRLSVFWLFAIVLLTVARATARIVVRRSDSYIQDTVIVGAGDVGQLLARKILQHPEYGLNVVGFVDANPKGREEGLGDLNILGNAAELVEIVRGYGIERVVVAFSNESHEVTLEQIRALDELDVWVDIVPRLFEVLPTQAGLHTIEGVPLLVLPSNRLARSALLVKRMFDLAFSLLLLVLLLPLLAIVAIAIKLDSPGPVLFRQTRMGAGDRVFRIYKFRTMRADADARKQEVAHLNKHATGDPRMFKIPNDPRVTRVGKVIRRYSIDELPQLFNVVLGDMSVVGPRPLILEEDKYVVDWRRRRLNLKPGITGLWQVLGRDGIPFDEMVKLDYLYVSTWSVFSDIKLILRTIPVLFRSHAC